MNHKQIKTYARSAGLTALCALALSACGGSDDDEDSLFGGEFPTPTPTTEPSPSPSPTPEPSPTPVAFDIGEDLGLSTSVLNETHRFDKPAVAITVSSAASSTAGFTDLTFEVVNTTLAQPLSPLVIAIHDPSVSLFEEGQSASVAIEQMAEGGSIDGIVEFATANPETVFASGALDAVLGPVGTASVTISIADAELAGAVVSAVGMLVNTNDAFAGADDVSLAGLSQGESMRLPTLVWDAGTEANTEAAGTMPGPADGGEGFNAARDDTIDAVRIHPGVVTNAYGVTTDS